jgi:hypothetical protein
MKRKLIFIFSFIPLLSLYSQVGINNTDPKTTLHITPTKTDNTTAEGIIAPNLTRAQLIDKDIRYTVLQKGAIVYVTAIDGVKTAKTTKITTAGYYYFDGSVWQPFGGGGGAVTVPSEPWRVQGGTGEAISNTQNIYQQGKVAIGVAQATSEAAETLLVDGSTRLKGSTVVDNLFSVGSTTLPTYYKMQIVGNGKGTGKDTNFGGLHVTGRTRMDEGLGIGSAPPPTGNGMMLDVSGIDGKTAVYIRKGDIESKGKVLAAKSIETNDIIYAKGGYIGLGVTFDLEDQKKNNKAAILQVASKKPASAGGATTGGNDPIASRPNNAGGGLGLSRANLGYSNSLQDFAFELTGGTGGGTSDEKLNATGTVLYNLGTANKTSKGLNMWNGERWANLGNVPFFFYMPSVNVDVSGTTTTLKSLDLYAEYQKQFAGTRTPARISNPSAPKAIAIYAKNEMDYYVTDYDATAIKVSSVSDAGVLYYYPTGKATESSYINVVFVLK